MRTFCNSLQPTAVCCQHIYSVPVSTHTGHGWADEHRGLLDTTFYYPHCAIKPFNPTPCFLSFNPSFSYKRTFLLLLPLEFNFFNSIWQNSVVRAFWKSRNIISAGSPLSACSLTPANTSSWFVEHEEVLLELPNLSLSLSLWLLIYLITLSFTKFVIFLLFTKFTNLFSECDPKTNQWSSFHWLQWYMKYLKNSIKKDR